MNNLEIPAIREFRRFACLHIYPQNIQKIMLNNNKDFSATDVTFIPSPQLTIKFISKIPDGITPYQHTSTLHNALAEAFVQFFNDPDIVKEFRSKVYTIITSSEQKNLLNTALKEIQFNNPKYLGLLFNITILKDNNVYIYL